MADLDLDALRNELATTRRELADVNAVLAAIRHGEADALLVDTADGPRVYVLRTADETYRTIVESLKEGAVTVTRDAVILYCNDAFASLVGRDGARLTGASLRGILDDRTIAALTTDGGARRYDCVLAADDGRRLDCHVSSARNAGEGEPVWCLIVTDLTGQTLRLRHDAIVESTDDAIASYDRDGRITTWNRAAERLFGYTADEVLGRGADLLVPVGRVDAAFLAARAGDKFQRDAHRIAKDGTVIDVSVTASPIRAHDGEIVGVSAILRDIRDRKAAEARIASIRDALSVEPPGDATNELLAETTSAGPRSTLDPARRMELVVDAELLDRSRTPALDQITRLAASVLQAPVSLITAIDDHRQLFVGSWGLPEPVRSARQTPLAVSYCRHVIESEAPLVIVDAEHNPLVSGIGAWQKGFVSYLGVPVHDRSGHVIASLSVADSRPRAWTQRELHTLQGVGRLLAREIENRAALTDRRRAEEAAAVRQRELEEADRQKNEFLAMLAHELRNPLAPIRTASELLTRTTGADAKTHAVADIVRRQAHQLTRIVDDLLDVSRITRGRIELSRETLDLAGIVGEAIEAVDPLLRERGHRLDVRSRDAPVHVNGDRVRLVQCVTNLLTNAAKYTDHGGRIRVACTVENGVAALTVADSGIGIAADLLPRVFDLFVQSERTLDRAAGGLGIGLSLVQRIAEMHGGTVEAASDGLGRGSTFTLRLPVADAPSDEPAVEGPRDATASRRVLIVDDNVDAADALAMLLRLEGHEVEAVHDARTGVERATAGRFDVVLLDIGLPGFDGYEAARRIRRALDGRLPRLIALTGYGQPEDRALALDAGFDDHVVKPVEVDDLQRFLDPGHRSGARREDGARGRTAAH